MDSGNDVPQELPPYAYQLPYVVENIRNRCIEVKNDPSESNLRNLFRFITETFIEMRSLLNITNENELESLNVQELMNKVNEMNFIPARRSLNNAVTPAAASAIGGPLGSVRCLGDNTNEDGLENPEKTTTKTS